MMQSASMLNKKKAVVLHRSDQRYIGDNTKVVGYLSAAIYGDWLNEKNKDVIIIGAGKIAYSIVRLCKNPVIISLL